MSAKKGASLLLVEEIENKRLLLELVRQLNKDFKLAGVDFQVKEEIMSHELVSILRSYLLRMITYNFDDYLNFLYRVDVSEHKVKSLKEINPDKIATAVTQIVLERECQKIWFKNKNRLQD